jgi:hypothetical protein
MIQKIKAPVTVITVYNHKTHQVVPEILKWDGKTYRISQIGYHHQYRQGRTLFHVFSVSSTELFFKLLLNTDNLHWELEEIADGLP